MALEKLHGVITTIISTPGTNIMGCVGDSPPINFVQNHFAPRLSVLFLEITDNPLNKMVFEHTLDELVKQVWGDEFVDVRMGKVFGEWLEGE